MKQVQFLELELFTIALRVTTLTCTTSTGQKLSLMNHVGKVAPSLVLDSSKELL